MTMHVFTFITNADFILGWLRICHSAKLLCKTRQNDPTSHRAAKHSFTVQHLICWHCSGKTSKMSFEYSLIYPTYVILKRMFVMRLLFRRIWSLRILIVIFMKLSNCFQEIMKMDLQKGLCQYMYFVNNFM